MKQFFLFAVIAAFATPNAFSQKKGDKYTHYFKDVEEPIESKAVNVELINGVSRTEFLKFKAKFINNTSDFLAVDPSKMTLTLGAIDLNPSEKAFILDPGDKKSKTIDVKEGADFLVDNFDVAPEGFAIISTDGTPIEMPDFQLPAAVNNLEAGNFEINLKRLKQETKETWAKFEVKYVGEDYGIVDPSRISIRIESGQQYANEFSKSKTILLEKGDKKTIDAVFHIPARVVDMQFATMFIQWGETMSETKAEPFELDETATFYLDDELTKEKN